jgi:FtsP/CotA-like multicopper oxidase with cupredoxin domain
MHAKNTITRFRQFLLAAPIALAALAAGAAHAAVPGIAGPSFALDAKEAFISQPDGASIYSWGFGCTTTPAGFLPAPGGVNLPNANCPMMQIPGPTLIVHKGDPVTVTLTNNLPAAAGNTSILFPGFNVTTSCSAATPTGTQGLLTCEAAHGGTVTYTFTADTEGTHSYYSGTQGDLQIEMGMFGAIIVLPTTIPGGCNTSTTVPAPALGVPNNLAAEAANGEKDYRLAAAAFSHSATCYDREYLFQYSEMDPRIHSQVEQQVASNTACTAPTGCLLVSTEPYHPAYFMINGRSMPDDMDPNYVGQYPNQPYNGNPHVHPGELLLVRVVGQGRWQHPFHEHANHVRLLARDGNLLLAPNAIAGDPADLNVSGATEHRLAGPLLFTTTTTPGQTLDAIFQWSGKGLNWDVYGHGYPGDATTCAPDANGFNTGDPTAANYWEWCADHDKPLESKPLGSVGGGGPMTLPEPNIVVNGPWYSGSAYFGPEAAARAVGPTPIPPFGTIANSSATEAGFAYMWHSHNEREITTNNIFPGGMLMMLLVDPRAYPIDESN